MSEKKALLKVGEVAARLSISIPHTYRLAASGELACIRIGGKALRFEESAVERFIRGRRGPGEKKAG